MNPDHATDWATRLAALLRSQGKTNPFLLAAQWGWRVILETEEESVIPTPVRLAEWDGKHRTIRIFAPTLCYCVGDSESALYRACAHELFHGLAASSYRSLPLTAGDIPPLNCTEEETAAQVFAEALLPCQATPA